jgi:hypothetical protein
MARDSRDVMSLIGRRISKIEWDEKGHLVFTLDGGKAWFLACDDRIFDRDGNFFDCSEVPTNYPMRKVGE